MLEVCGDLLEEMDEYIISEASLCSLVTAVICDIERFNFIIVI
jgi:hypothetical protein